MIVRIYSGMAKIGAKKNMLPTPSGQNSLNYSRIPRKNQFPASGLPCLCVGLQYILDIEKKG